MAQNAEFRIYRTTDGELVWENDPRGAFLAYAVGDEVQAAEVAAYRALVGGERSGHEVPGLMHDQLATEIADAARLQAANPAGPAAEAARETLRTAADLVDADKIEPPAPPSNLPPSEIVRQVADGDLAADGTNADDAAAADQKSTAPAGRTKAAAKPADKAAAKPADKAATNTESK
jgi:hypothetical protein